jgi:hypothetical protein
VPAAAAAAAAPLPGQQPLALLLLQLLLHRQALRPPSPCNSLALITAILQKAHNYSLAPSLQPPPPPLLLLLHFRRRFVAGCCAALLACLGSPACLQEPLWLQLML